MTLRGSGKDWDIKLAFGADARYFRLLQQRDQNTRALRKIFNATPNDAREDHAREFKMDDWRFGFNYKKIPETDSITSQTQFNRIYDGHGVLLEDGLVKHGPLKVGIGSLVDAPVDSLYFNGLQYFLTATRLYSYDGTTLTQLWAGGTGLVQMAVYKASLILAAGSNGYWVSDGTATPPSNEADVADGIAVRNKQLWRYDNSTHLIYSSVDPDGGSPTWSTGLDLVDGQDFTNMYVQSGLLWLCTDDTVFVVSQLDIDGSEVAFQMDTRLQTRRSANAWSISSAIGSETWLADGAQNIFRVTVTGFNEFELTPVGPFTGDEGLPVSDLTGTVSGIAHDLEDVYVTAKRGDDLYIYRGKRVAPGRYAWSPMDKISTGGAANTILHVSQLAAQSAPFLYANVGLTIFKWQVKDWTTYAPDWEIQTPYFVADDETVTNVWHRIRTFTERVGAAIDMQAAYRTDHNVGWTNIGAVIESNGQAARNMGNAASFRIQFRFVVDNASATSEKIDLKSFTVDGEAVPELRRRYDFTIIADSQEDADYLNSLRGGGGTVPILTTPLGNAVSIFIDGGFPALSVMEDDRRLGDPVSTFRIVGVEILS